MPSHTELGAWSGPACNLEPHVIHWLEMGSNDTSRDLASASSGGPHFSSRCIRSLVASRFLRNAMVLAVGFCISKAAPL